MGKEAKVTDEFLTSLPIITRDGRKMNSEKEEQYMRELCEFEFYNLEESGLAQRFAYGNTKKNHTFTFFHGGRYRIPRFIAQWVESCSTPIWDWRPNGTGQMEKRRIGERPRFQMRHIFSSAAM